MARGSRPAERSSRRRLAIAVHEQDAEREGARAPSASPSSASLFVALRAPTSARALDACLDGVVSRTTAGASFASLNALAVVTAVRVRAVRTPLSTDAGRRSSLYHTMNINVERPAHVRMQNVQVVWCVPSTPMERPVARAVGQTGWHAYSF